MTPVTAGVLAHQGGWDEILFVLTPLAVFAGLLVLARRRADQLDRTPPDEQHEAVAPASAESGDHLGREPDPG